MQYITPKDKNISVCLSNRKYYIDFYQREYVWSKETVEILLNDIMYSFNLSYEEHKNENLNTETINKFDWYYLNVFITNESDGKTYIVDGQQRLTTLTLIAVYLYGRTKNSNIKDNLQQCIYSTDLDCGKIFNIDNDKRERAMESLLNQQDFKKEYSCITEQTIIERYKDIKKYFEQEIKKQIEKEVERYEFNNKDEENKIKENIETNFVNFFSFYFLRNLVLVELSINKKDTPMVFEAINDRGEALKPFEILKGKLLGALSTKQETDKYDDIWQNAIGLLPKMEDRFFIDFIKAKFVFKRNSEQEKLINNEYHRYLFSTNDIAKKLGFQKQNSNQIQKIKDFLENDLTYYAKLYSKIRENSDEFLMYSNKINNLDGIYQNILAACEINDKFEDEKIKILAKEVDRLYVLLQLNQSYNSNKFQEISYSLNEKLQKETPENYRNIFNEIIKEQIKESKNKENVISVLDCDTFGKNSYAEPSKRMLIKYVLARVEKYFRENNIGEKSQNLVYEISTTSGKNGYHIEHILSHNETNKSYFDSEEEFEDKRNLIGGLLLLKGRSNISSGNEEYVDKLKTYSNGLVWGHTLCDDFYHANPDLDDFNKSIKTKTGVEFEPISEFDKEALNKRTRLLFELVKIIWEVDE